MNKLVMIIAASIIPCAALANGNMSTRIQDYIAQSDDGTAGGNYASVAETYDDVSKPNYGASVLGSDNSLAVGHASRIEGGTGNMALGQGAEIRPSKDEYTSNSVVIGYKSQANESNVVSFGTGSADTAAPSTRRLINVSDGVKDSDAVTRRQLDEAKNSVAVLAENNAASIAASNARQQTHSEQIATNTRSVQQNNELIAVNREQLNSHAGQIAANTRGLALTREWQKMANSRMERMEKHIADNRKELRESAAQSAALAGLFQPYSVGKFNATAAVGGYSDKQAVAVGVGYRFSSQVAGKMAVAAGGDSVSWNAGMNLEF